MQTRTLRQQVLDGKRTKSPYNGPMRPDEKPTYTLAAQHAHRELRRRRKVERRGRA